MLLAITVATAKSFHSETGKFNQNEVVLSTEVIIPYQTVTRSSVVANSRDFNYYATP
jgi:hypothetical protein